LSAFFTGVFQFDPAAIGVVVFRTLVVYVMLFVGLRVAGKRELGQMTTIDLVVVLVIANAVQNAMVGFDTSLTSGLVAAFTLLAVNWAVARLGLRWARFGRGLLGTPTVLISHGEFVLPNLRREGIHPDEVLMALRGHGVAKPDDVDLAVLEVDGTISVVPMNDGAQRTKRRIRGRKPAG
jgi:uncharacterized membrane protein YcaP (DUF421 family)